MTKKSPSSAATNVTSAAGAVLWRPDEDDSNEVAAPLVAVVHRPRYDDWSLPKGKVDPGETEPVTAVREVLEETGYASELGRRLAAVSYPIESGVKHVRYWAARAVGGEFTPNGEVDELVWLSPPTRSNDCSIPTIGRCCAASPRSPRTPARCWSSATGPRAARPGTKATTATAPGQARSRAG